jgi:hypothetical protein
MIRKFLILSLFFLLLTNCGYGPIYSSKNLNFSINNIEKQNNILNNKFAEIIKGLVNNNDNRKINIGIESNKNVEIKSKDTKGNPLIYELNISLTITIIDSDKKSKVFKESTSFSNNDDKFELSNYQKELEEVLIRKLAEQAIIYLSNL